MMMTAERTICFRARGFPLSDTLPKRISQKLSRGTVFLLLSICHRLSIFVDSLHSRAGIVCKGDSDERTIRPTETRNPSVHPSVPCRSFLSPSIRSFLVAMKRLDKSVCPSVRPSVGMYVCNAFAFRPSRSDVYRVY